MAVRVLPHSITSKRGCDGFNHIRHTLANQRRLDTIVSAHKLKRFPPCHRISYLLLAKIDGIVVGNLEIPLNLIILSHDFILLLYAAILPKVAPKNVQIPVSSIILLAFTFWACR